MCRWWGAGGFEEHQAMTADTILEANESGDQFAGRIAPFTGPSPVVAIVGPTASGKSALAIALGRHFPIEIVNADSRAFYRGMDTGTAKPTLAERAYVPHHLIDILEPDGPMSVSLFQSLAMDAIAAIHARDRLPVIAGGTPQYVNALLEGWQIPEVPPNEDRRRELEREAESIGVEPILVRLAAVDPEGAERAGPNLRRIIRALEVYEATGIPFSQLRQRRAVPFRALEFELWLPRDLLYARIDRRVDQMIADGLVEEVRQLLARGYDPALPAFSSIGYRQLVPAIAGGADLAEAIARIKLDTHRLVRHQQTWFRRNDRLIRVDMTDPRALDTVVSQVRAFLDSGSRPE
jgi:tRNA dimethylallyltransferase